MGWRGLVLAVFGFAAVAATPLMMNVSTDDMSRLRSAVPPVLRDQYDGHGGATDVDMEQPPVEGATTPVAQV
jgi:hypothetical protein